MEIDPDRTTAAALPSRRCGWGVDENWFTIGVVLKAVVDAALDSQPEQSAGSWQGSPVWSTPARRS